jgi:hypothetical protein
MPLSDFVQQVPESIFGMDLNQAVFHSRGREGAYGAGFHCVTMIGMRALGHIQVPVNC